MKKFFTLIAAAFMTMGMNAQTITFTEALPAESAQTITLGDKDFGVTFVGGSKASVVEKSQSFKVDASSDVIQFSYQWQPGGGITKLTGERSVTINVSTGGTLTVCARTGKSGEVRNFNVMQNGTTLLTAAAPDGKEIEEKYYKAYTVEVEAGTVNITAESQINIAGLVFASNGESGGGSSGETIEIAKWAKGTTIGTWTVEQAAEGNVVTDGTGKYNSNTTTVNAVKFTKSITSSGDFVAAFKVTVEGGFKKGDKITVQPFTSMSTTDYKGGSKYANILVYDAEKKQIANLTNSAAGALTVTDGHEESGDPKTFEYTLESDYTELYFGRGGNTNIFVMNLVIERETPTAVNTIKENVQAAGKSVKLVKNGKLIIVKNGNEYNAAGQQVK